MGINIRDIIIRYGDLTVVDKLSLFIKQGSFFTLLGPSGCGKTTLLRAIAGFVQPASGSIQFGATDVTRLQPHRRDIGMVFQDYALFPDKTVFDNVAYGLRARRRKEAEIKSKVGAALERVGLGHLGERHPAALSGGQRQRVALARALVIEPQVLLMDEPLSNLDAKLRVQIRGIISELQKEAGITTVFVTHDQEEALSMSDRIGVMNQGRLDQVGSPKDIYTTPASEYVADFVGSANLLKVELPGERNGDGLTAFTLAGKRMAGDAGNLSGRRDATLVLRPEDIKVSLVDSDDAIAGCIRQKQYLGAKTHYKVELNHGSMISVELNMDEHDKFELGAAIFLRFDPHKSRILA